MVRPPKPAGHPSSVRGKREQQQTSNMRKKKRVPIDELHEYWIDISKRQNLTVTDYKVFFERAATSMEYFQEYYDKHFPRDRFFDRVGIILFTQRTLDSFLGPAIKRKELSNQDYVLMKDVAKTFGTRINRCFAREIVSSIKARSPLQDAEKLLAYSPKLTYKWAAGIIASNHIANLLIQLSRFRRGEKIHKDDIRTLADNLKNRTTNRKLQTFLTRSYRRFEDADKLRNRCAHVIEGEPTKQEIEQSIALARLLQRYIAGRKKL